ncbi:MAG: hypothetical protein RL596_2201 [Bacteroidota bacterium]
MNSVKKILGIVWMITAPVQMGLHQMAAKPSIDTKIQWGVFIGIFLPIAIGLFIFGYYAWRGEYKG